MVTHPPTTCLILRLPLRAIHHQPRGATAMERVPRITLSLMPDHHRVILAMPLVTTKANPTNHSTIRDMTTISRSINSTVGSLSLPKVMAALDMAVHPNRSMLRIKATVRDTTSNHHPGNHSMIAIKRSISWLAWQLTEFQKLLVWVLVCGSVYVRAFV